MAFWEWNGSGLVPAYFQNEFKEGNRVAVFGRWIVDCAHNDFHAEIHPPLLLGAASVYTQPVANNRANQSQAPFTRALFTSRPYLVGQTFANGTNTDQIYNDGSGDDDIFCITLLRR